MKTEITTIFEKGDKVFFLVKDEKEYATLKSYWEVEHKFSTEDLFFFTVWSGEVEECSINDLKIHRDRDDIETNAGRRAHWWYRDVPKDLVFASKEEAIEKAKELNKSSIEKFNSFVKYNFKYTS